MENSQQRGTNGWSNDREEGVESCNPSHTPQTNYPWRNEARKTHKQNLILLISISTFLVLAALHLFIKTSSAAPAADSNQKKQREEEVLEGKILRVLYGFWDFLTDRQMDGAPPPPPPPPHTSTSGKNPICRGFSRRPEEEIEQKQPPQTGARPLCRAVISYAQDKLLTQSHAACCAGACLQAGGIHSSTCLSTSPALPCLPLVFAITI